MYNIKIGERALEIVYFRANIAIRQDWDILAAGQSVKLDKIVLQDKRERQVIQAQHKETNRVRHIPQITWILQ